MVIDIYQNDTNDMITKLEKAYIHMCDSVTESLNGWDTVGNSRG